MTARIAQKGERGRRCSKAMRPAVQVHESPWRPSGRWRVLFKGPPTSVQGRRVYDWIGRADDKGVRRLLHQRFLHGVFTMTKAS